MKISGLLAIIHLAKISVWNINFCLVNEYKYDSLQSDSVADIDADFVNIWKSHCTFI